MFPQDLNKKYAGGENFLHFFIKKASYNHGNGCYRHHAENAGNVLGRGIKILVEKMDEKAKIAKDNFGKTPLDLLDLSNAIFYSTNPKELLKYTLPAYKVQEKETFNMGKKVRHKLNPKLGMGKIVKAESVLESDEIKYTVAFSTLSNLELTVVGSDLEVG